MRPRILYILLKKEMLRLKKNPSAIALLFLLASIALLVSLNWSDPVDEKVFAKCYVAYADSWKDSEFIHYLETTKPSDIDLELIAIKDFVQRSDQFSFEDHECAIELLATNNLGFKKQSVEVRYHYAEDHESEFARATSWFWSSWKQFGAPNTQFKIRQDVRTSVADASGGFASTLRENAANRLDLGLISTMLLLAVQFFACCHLYVSFASQDRERGTLRAIAMSPASLIEIVFSRALFHQSIGLGVCALVLLIVAPNQLTNWQVWLTLIAAGFGWLSVGTIITSVTRTQSQSSMFMFCYMLAGGILFFMAAQFPIVAAIQDLTFENHAVQLIHASLSNNTLVLSSLLAMLLGAPLWISLALNLFRRWGWQS